jgi:hypothetical protein
VPGSCTQQSDWDFYVDGSAASVGCAIKALAEQGVVWDDLYAPFIQLMEADEYHPVNMPRAHLNEYIHTRAIVGRYQPRGDVAAELGEIYAHRRQHDFRVGAHGHLSTRRGGHTANTEYYRTPDLNMITGHTTHGSQQVKVQLIFSKKLSPMEEVMSYYASHVQCAITAYGGVHFYFSDAAESRGFTWPNNSQAPHAAPKAISKYRSRGWTFIEQTDEEMQAHIIKQMSGAPDNGAKVELFNLDLGLPGDVERHRRIAFQRLAWQEVEGSTALIRVSPPSHKSGVVRRFKTNTELADFDDDVEVAIAHSVAFPHFGRRATYAHANDILTL